MNPNPTLTSSPAILSSQHIYQNIMESLVHSEIDRQLKALPPHAVRFIDPVDVATYALNRLPSLYASTESGKQHQQQIGQTQMRGQIVAKVRQAIAAVQRDPIRLVTPLRPNLGSSDYQMAQQALTKVDALLKKYNLDSDIPLNWENLPLQIKKAIKKIVKPQLHSLTKLERLLQQYEILTDCKVTQRNFVDIIAAILEQIYCANQGAVPALDEE